MTAHIINIETLDEGLSAFKEGKFNKSIHDLSKVIRLDPKMEIAYENNIWRSGHLKREAEGILGEIARNV